MASGDGVKRQFAADCTEWYASVPSHDLNWTEALLAAALDECGGDLLKALGVAQTAYETMR